MDKKICSFVALLFFAVSAMAVATDEGPVLSFDQENFDYGTVYVDEIPETKNEITFTNTGTQPLLLSNVRACCGTRVTEWPRDPIMPGEQGTIKVEFRLAPRPQNIRRTITVTSNSESNPTAIFRIIGTVIERD